LDNAVSCTIVLPCYNPQQYWVSRIVEQHKALSARLGAPISIVLVNDGSTTGITQNDIDILRKEIPSFEYVTYAGNKGKGYALRQGVARADTDIIIYTDIDFPYSTDSVASIFETLYKEGYDIAIGIKNSSYYAKVPPVRRYISKILRSLIGIFFRIPVTDTQCGLKGFKCEVKDVFLSTTINRYLFDLEFVRNVYKQQYKAKPVPVQLNNNVVFRRMNYRLLIPEIINFVKIIFRKP